MYGLHLFSAITGVLTPALVVTAFLTGWPSIIAVVLNYLKAGDVQGTYLESHFNWQIRTFWFTAIWLLIAGALFITVIGMPIAVIIIAITGIWVLYRMARGVLNMLSEDPMPSP
jgi:uncharacterized membrane protein